MSIMILITHHVSAGSTVKAPMMIITTIVTQTAVVVAVPTLHSVLAWAWDMVGRWDMAMVGLLMVMVTRIMVGDIHTTDGAIHIMEAIGQVTTMATGMVTGMVITMVEDITPEEAVITLIMDMAIHHLTVRVDGAPGAVQYHVRAAADRG